MNKRVFISGGTGSVGQALVERFAKNGDDVTFQFFSNERRAADITKRIGAISIKIDLSRPFEVADVDFDILINNAGVNLSDHSTDACTDAEWSETLAVNLSAPFQLSRALLPCMRKKRWGRIINVSSIYGLRAVEGNCPYTVSKHGLSGLTKTIAKEFAADGITCNEICPGPINSELMERVSKRSFAPDYASPAEYLRDVISTIPSRRLAEPAEIVALALFLASKEASYINGVSIPVDGGLIS